MRVDVHAAGHHHHPARVDYRRRSRYGVDDRALIDADIAHLAIDAIRRVVDRAAGDSEFAHRVMRSRIARTISTGSRPRGTAGRSRSGTSSMRRAVPFRWIPATPVSIVTIAVCWLAAGPTMASAFGGKRAQASAGICAPSPTTRTASAAVAGSCGRYIGKPFEKLTPGG